MIFNDDFFKDLADRIVAIQQDIEDIKNSQTNTKGEEWLCNGDVCRIFKIAPRTLMYYRKKKILPSYKIEGKILYKRSEIESVIMGNNTHNQNNT